jgi:hypothetical protein
MDLKSLLSIGIFTILTVLTILSWREYLGSPRAKEGFADVGAIDTRNSVMSDQIVQMLTKQNEPVPTDLEAVKAHQTLLRYIRNNYQKGVKFVLDLGDRFFENPYTFRHDLDVRTLLDNYQSPLQRV